MISIMEVITKKNKDRLKKIGKTVGKVGAAGVVGTAGLAAYANKDEISDAAKKAGEKITNFGKKFFHDNPGESYWDDKVKPVWKK